MAYISTEPSRRATLGFARPEASITELDGLRALAILLVLARHITVPLQARAPDALIFFGYDFAIPLANGWIGVDLFFVLSGFLITRHLITKTRLGEGVRMVPYLTARALRIVPAYLAVTGLVMIGAFPFYLPDADASSVLVHLLFLQDYLGADIVVAFWSLGVEEKFYICAPFLVLGALHCEGVGRRYCFLIALIVTPLVLRTLTWQAGVEADTYTALFRNYRSPFHLTFDGLAIGATLAFLRADGIGLGPLGRKLVLFVSLGVLSVLVIPSQMMQTLSVLDVTVQPLLIALSFGGITFVALNRESDRPSWLGAMELYPIAVLSYALYLVHMPLIPLCILLASSGGSFSAPLFAGYVVTLSFVAAWVLHLAVEKPFLALKASLAQKIV